MNLAPELIALIQRDREREIAQGRNARLLACLRSCCSPSLFESIARALRLATPA